WLTWIILKLTGYVTPLTTIFGL
ncbi:MAG: hypothetical protein JWL86_6129, partial [Rhizobium sp.]|nr:hypothetical protein [Rhizobium sp.]